MGHIYNTTPALIRDNCRGGEWKEPEEQEVFYEIVS